MKNSLHNSSAQCVQDLYILDTYFLINYFRLIKEFDRELKDEEGRNPPEVNKQLNDEKQSMVSIWNLLCFAQCLMNMHMHNRDKLICKVRCT